MGDFITAMVEYKFLNGIHGDYIEETLNSLVPKNGWIEIVSVTYDSDNNLFYILLSIFVSEVPLYEE